MQLAMYRISLWFAVPWGEAVPEVRTKEWYKSPSARRFVESHGFDPETQSSFVQAQLVRLANPPTS
eukprot:4803165-Amphidinium_carterae.1